MTRSVFCTLAPAVVACGILGAPGTSLAQVAATDLLVRLDQLESQVRQLTGAIEQLQFRNQQLEQSLKRVQEDNEFRFHELGAKGAARPGPRPAVQPAPPAGPAPASGIPGRRSDAFDPAQNPNAPGVPRTLGALGANGGAAHIEPPGPPEPPIGAPNGRSAGAPLDLSTLAANAVKDPTLGPSGGPPADNGPLPPPPPRNPSATGAQVATLPPSHTPRDEFDLAYGYMLRKDYALAEESFRAFLKKHSNDRLASDAQYWLGESMFQRQSYRDAADAFLNLSKKYESSPKAAEGLLRLGQSLAALKEKELACATLAEVGRKYPRASQQVKQTVEREQKRVRC